jgi:D-serine deaminase-like pyridoxal phosphate-dependent protein
VELGSKGITVKKISVFTSDFAVMKHLKFSIKTEIIDSYGIFETRDFQMSPVGVITSVMSHPQSDMVYLDCGQKSISIDQGMPKPIDLQKSSVSQMSAEHGYLQIRDANWLPKLGDRVGLSPSDVSDTFNLYNYLNIISNGILKAIYEIDGRGYYV